MKTTPRILVAGGGPAGMMAALQAARHGASVALLEKNTDLGRKLLLTGNGRCNLTNQADPRARGLVAMMPGQGRFLYGAFSRFGPEELRHAFAELGVATKVEAGGRVFPASDRARDVLQALEQGLRAAGVEILTGQRVEAIETANGRISGLVAGGQIQLAEAVILATGGLSYPRTGSTGDGYALATAAGHKIVAPRASLVPLRTAEKWAGWLEGLSLVGIKAALFGEDRPLAEGRGDLIFTRHGVSGPLVFDLSREAVAALGEGWKVRLDLDLKPELTEEMLEARLRISLDQHGKRQVEKVLAEFFPPRLRPVLLDLAGLAEEKPAHQVTREERLALARLAKRFCLGIEGAAPIEAATVTAGGVTVTEVDPRTMESKLVKGLYFAGELLDVDGRTGGFNLQAAFSTGYVAGWSAAQNDD